MALVNVGDGDLSGGSDSRRLGLQKRKRQEEVCCRRVTRSLAVKQRLEERERIMKLINQRQMTPAEMKIYNEQVRKTGGFDVCIPDDVSPVSLCGLIIPQPNFDKSPLMYEWAKRSAREAIKCYNKQEDAKFKFMRIVKLNSMDCAGYNFYITFEAKAKDAAPMYFQALVYFGIPINKVIEVKFCHPQPKLD
ncbi:hypothetical protein Vadar_030921 [Vaccinium darrowii]|uniref:Uncharacterized protein n=1 Tax=Vaccinium darrowii TaxID=229202 RepID=A0ACB7Y3F4_9ERIC|nr:hypothetical protein Vadar_030921 [Vaccinium darrowii]